MRRKWRLDLQLFAADGGDGGANNEGKGNGNGSQGDQNGSEGDSSGQGAFQPTPEMQEWLQKAIQSETDKVRTQYSKQLKQLENEKEALLKEKMTEEEKAKYELQKRESALLEKERAMQRQSVEIEATNLLTTAELPLKFKEFILADDVESTKTRINNFKQLWDAAVSEEVTRRMASGGRRPPGDNAGGKVGTTMNDLIRGAFGR